MHGATICMLMKHRFKNNKSPLKRISLRMPKSDFDELVNGARSLYTGTGLPMPPMSDNLIIQRACAQAVQCLKYHAQQFSKK
jgi:hypothetical protein